MHPQLAVIADDLRAAKDRLHRLRQTAPAERWGERAEPASWSMAECVEHLNLTTSAFRKGVEAALVKGEATRSNPPRRHRRDFLGWLLWRTMPPPVRFKVRTGAAFVPQETAPADELIAEFDRLQDEQLKWVKRADGLPLSRLRVHSPFDPRGRMTYNLYSALSILPRHQHRHLWQAERVWVKLARG